MHVHEEYIYTEFTDWKMINCDGRLKCIIQEHRKLARKDKDGNDALGREMQNSLQNQEPIWIHAQKKDLD